MFSLRNDLTSSTIVIDCRDGLGDQQVGHLEGANVWFLSSVLECRETSRDQFFVE